MTSTVLPDFLAQASAAFFTAAVSASPELPIMIVSLTGPLAVLCGACWAPLLKPPPPQALRTSAPVAARARAAAPRVLRALMSLHFPFGAVTRRFRAGPDDKLGGKEEAARGVAGARTGAEHVEHAVGDLVEGLVEATEVEGVRDVGVVETDEADIHAGFEPSLHEDPPRAEGERVRGTDDGAAPPQDVGEPGGRGGGGGEVLGAGALPLGVRDAELGGGSYPPGPAVVAHGAALWPAEEADALV